MRPDGGGDEDLQALVATMREQLEAQKRAMEEQLALQREHMRLQQRQMERQVELLESFVNAQKHPSQAGGSPPRPGDAAATSPRGPGPGSSPSEPPGERMSRKSSTAEIDSAKVDVELFKHCSGLHTVAPWVTNYTKHPAGWGALLMIHGIPEVTSRLRLKVQNYAIFSALFVAGTIKAMSGPQPVCNPDPDTWECHIRKRVFTYGFTVCLASHILCILLAMGFHNVLNECARDSDVYRLFGRGKGFLATTRCQYAFRVGVLACCVALTAVAQEDLGWEIVVFAAVVAAVVVGIHEMTIWRLFRSGSIVDYWRPELGGKPDPTDPYDLSVPVKCFNKGLAAENECFGVKGSEFNNQSDSFAAMM